MNDPLSDFDREILQFLAAAGGPQDAVQLTTPELQFGERATNVAFHMAKEWRRAPRQVADELARGFDPGGYRFLQAVQPAGAGFLNFRVRHDAFVPHAIDAIRRSGDFYGRASPSIPQKP
jgi:arginyl-tRNA synthetase